MPRRAEDRLEQLVEDDSRTAGRGKDEVKDDGTIEMVTPPLGDMILPGVTRDSVLTLAKDHASGANKLKGMPAKFKVSERNLTSEHKILAS